MKKLLLIGAIIFMTACKSNYSFTYKVKDIPMSDELKALKPDSAKLEGCMLNLYKGGIVIKSVAVSGKVE